MGQTVMKLGVLAWAAGEAESTGIAAEAQRRGHETVLFEFDDIRCLAAGSGPRPQINGHDAASFDVVLSRGHVGLDNWRIAAEHLHLLSSVPGVLVLDPADVHVAAVGKFTMLHKLAQAGVPVPPTRECASVSDFLEACEAWGRVVLKPSVGFGGIDVERFVEGPTEEAVNQVKSLLIKYGVLLAQPFLEHTGDYRITLIGDEPSVCVKALTHGDAWRQSHGHGSGPARSPIEVIEPPADLLEVSRLAARALDLSMAGIDVIYFHGRPVVIEANVVPGWDGFTQENQNIVNRDVVDYVERRFQER
ncbi:ATP-grasp domain-containing protein [Streptomyces sp. NPDC004126]|uniref:ATP-grasp domain-containing protein n=1 Tax=Streptomyces sp. NPDC004126 TaxID=3390695 RepID=UPI003D03A5C5